LNAITTSATPRCPHFGSCGGCQLQNLNYEEQLALKRKRLHELLQSANVEIPDEIAIHSSRSYSYRNRIRLRLQRIEGILRFGYNRPGTTEFLPITVCPISAPILIQIAEALLTTAEKDRDAKHWIDAAAEVELFVNDELTRVQLTLFCAPRTKSPQGSLQRLLKALQREATQVVGIGAEAFDPRTGPTGRTLAEAGTSGLNYRVPVDAEAEETYWITRGGFFQVNRFLLPTLVELVCRDADRPRSGSLVWDLFSGVGLFSRVLASSFKQVIAVEANPTAIADLSAVFRKLGQQHKAVESTTLDFLRSAVLQRERPDLIVLDPPRAGAGIEASELLNRIAPQQIVYVSCDPTTLARDLAVLQASYTVSALHLIDLFPQTSHIEAMAVLTRST
jgi:23S rRNA (uracil1939-C5)-methyltransferase